MPWTILRWMAMAVLAAGAGAGTLYRAAPESPMPDWPSNGAASAPDAA